jgi:CRP/FNR family cyclic AMP-dependent transcriptional regulator
MLRPQLLQAIPNVESFLHYCEVRDYPTRTTILREGEHAPGCTSSSTAP